MAGSTRSALKPRAACSSKPLVGRECQRMRRWHFFYFYQQRMSKDGMREQRNLGCVQPMQKFLIISLSTESDGVWIRSRISIAPCAGGSRTATVSGTAHRQNLAPVAAPDGTPSGPPAAAPAAATSGQKRSAIRASSRRRTRPGITIHRTAIARAKKSGNLKPRGNWRTGTTRCFRLDQASRTPCLGRITCVTTKRCSLIASWTFR